MENWFIIQIFFWPESSSPRIYWCWGMKITSLKNSFLAKTKMMNNLDLNPWAKSRSRAEVKWKGTFGSPAAWVPFLVWLGQEWLFDQKDAFSQESSLYIYNEMDR
jgi:hypothetical protein